MADEWGYLGAARRIAGDGGQTHVPYHAGAGLLYLPATLVADTPIGAYDGALATNAVLAGLLTLAAWWVAGLAAAAARAVGAVRGGVRRRPLHVVPRLLQPGGAGDRVRGAGAGAGRRVRPRAARPADGAVGAGRRGLRAGVAAAPARRRGDRRRRRRRAGRAAAARPAPGAARRVRRPRAGRRRRHDGAGRLGERPRDRSRAVRLRRPAGRPVHGPRAAPAGDHHGRPGVLPQRRHPRHRDARRARARAAPAVGRAGPAGGAVPAPRAGLRLRHLGRDQRPRQPRRPVPLRPLQRGRDRTAAARRVRRHRREQRRDAAAGATSPRPAASRFSAPSRSTAWPGPGGCTTACTSW